MKKKSIIGILLVTILFSIISISTCSASEKDDARLEKLYYDLERLTFFVNSMESVMAEIDAGKDLFSVEKPEDMTKAQKDNLVRIWISFLDHQVELNKFVDEYKHFYKINYLTKRRLHVMAYLIGYAAYVSSYNNGVKFIDLTIDNKIIEKTLNDSYLEHGLPSGMFSRLKRNVLHVNDVVRLTAGYGNFKFLYSDYEKYGMVQSNKGLFDLIERSYKESTKKLKKEAVIWFPKSGLKTFKERTYTVLFPIQKNIATKMGETRATLRHDNFVSVPQIIEMKKEMEPGDILLERRNWYTSNIGIPGFWPHAALYIGRFSELVDYFDTPEIKKYLEMNEHTDISGLFNEINSDFYKKFAGGQMDVIEAVSPGVVLKPLIESAKADYVGVLRARKSKLDKFKAICSAIKYYGRPYDYHFDFVSDSAIVCSELVYKAYNGIVNFETTHKLGRFIVTATDFAKKFDTEFGKDSQELDFVYFLDGSEKKKSAFVRGVKELRKSWQRPKWDISQK